MEEGYPRAEEAVRLLSGAVGAARLYPATSHIPREAALKFVTNSNALAAAGPLRLFIDPQGFHVAGARVAVGQTQVSALAESLHALQVGQLVIVAGVEAAEVDAFVRLANSDPATVRAAGGFRAALVQLGVSHIAAIEVSLRASDEVGLVGIDLLSAPLDELATEVAAAAERRASAANDGPATDEVAEAIDKLEDAMREIAAERIAAAMMRLDERTRLRILGLSLKADTNGQRMEGALAAIAHMKPAALARLLTLVAKQADTDPRRIAAALTLPPEAAKLLALMLTPKPQLDADFGVPATEQAAMMAKEVAREEDTRDLDRQVAVASPALSAGRALSTAIAVSRTSLTEDTVRAMSDVLPKAAKDGAFQTVREALRRLDEIAAEPSFADDVVAARASLADPTVLAEVCLAPLNDADAAIAGEILRAAGPAGAEALLDAYIRVPESRRSLLRPVLRGLSESVLGVARQQLRTADPAVAIAIVRALPHLGDRRAITVIADALDNLDEQVRFAAASALAAMPVPEATSALVRAINHREPETQRHVVREVGKRKIAEAVPVLSRALQDLNVFRRTYETRKEIIGALEAIGTPEAEKALRRFAQQTVSLGRKTTELRNRAKRVADELANSRGVSQ